MSHLLSHNAPQVSVIIPAYNAGQYIASAMRSVVAQTLFDWELIVVDDGSTDDTLEQVTAFLSDPRITLHRKPNGGPSSARNAGVTLAKSNLIALLDADDYWMPAKLDKQVAIMSRYPDVGVCGSGRTIISPNGDHIRHIKGNHFHGMPFPRLLFAPLADMSMALIRRCVFDKSGLFDESLLLSEDYEFWLRVGRDHCFYIIPEPLVCIRTGYTSTSGSWQARRAYFHNYILPRFLNEQHGRLYVRPRHLRKLKAREYKYRGDESIACATRLQWYLRSIFTYPFSAEPYGALGSTMLPLGLRRLLRFLKHGNSASS